MKTKHKSIVAIAVTAVCSILLFTACKPHHSRGTFVLDYVTEALDLNDDQQKKLDSIRTELEEKIKDMHGNKEEMHAALKEQLKSEVIDKDIITQLIAEHRRKMDEVIDLAVDRLTVFHSELTPEQKEKLIAKFEKFEKHHHGSIDN